MLSITDKVREYAAELAERERAVNTVQKYLRDLNRLVSYAGGRQLDKALLVSFKRELTLGEYKRLVSAADERTALVMQTLCATGIRVSELKFITARAVREGRAVISCKGKSRVVFLPEKLRRLLAKYVGRRTGAVFVTRSGKPLDRSNIWRDMKRLCGAAGVAEKKVFPHNLRRLFARTYYSLEKDLSRLADILGHSAVNTTRIYTMESGKVHAKQINRLGLVLDTT